MVFFKLYIGKDFWIVYGLMSFYDLGFLLRSSGIIRTACSVIKIYSQLVDNQTI